MATDTSAGPRSVFSGVDSQTYITLPHSRTSRTDRPGKLVARYLPMALNCTFLKYMLLAQPFLNSLLHARHGRQVDWLFRRRDGLAITSSCFADVLKAHTGQWGLPKGLKVAAWRQLVAAMIRFHASSEAERRLLEREEAEEEEMDNLAEQANHSATVAHLHYGLNIGDVKDFGQDDLFRSRRACEAWHRLLKLYESPVL